MMSDGDLDAADEGDQMPSSVLAANTYSNGQLSSGASG